MELRLRIILERPPAGVYFGLQKGHGSNYETVQTVELMSDDLHFEFNVRVRQGKDGDPNFLGPFVQGPPHERFVYLDIGTCAGQTNTAWSRRLKIPLRGITYRKRWWTELCNGEALCGMAGNPLNRESTERLNPAKLVLMKTGGFTAVARLT